MATGEREWDCASENALDIRSVASALPEPVGAAISVFSAAESSAPLQFDRRFTDNNSAHHVPRLIPGTDPVHGEVPLLQ